MINESELNEAFEQRKPVLRALGEWVISVISSELSTRLAPDEAVEMFLKIPPIPRVKSTDSFLEKAFIRKPKADPLSEITDQVGVRFVVLLLEDIDVIGTIIKSCKEWTWTKDRDYEQERLEPKSRIIRTQNSHF